VLARGGWLPLGLVGVAAATDYIDGPLARRGAGASRHGALLDNVADVVFVLAGTIAGVAQGMLDWYVPVAIACAATAYLAASIRRTRAAGVAAPAYSVVGHAAGVVNYGLVVLVAASVALPGGAWPAVLAAGGGAVTAINLAAVALRLVPRARASRA
jgi:cardiolipin synthase (CMP-forming)